MITLWIRGFILATIVTALGLLVATSTAPVAAEQQVTQISPEDSVVNEETLLGKLRRVEGLIDQPDTRARVLIQPAGRIWDHFDQVTLHWFGAIVILGTIAGLVAGYFLLGRLRISAGRSGRKVERFNAFERFLHWLTAVSFVVLGISGLNITFGKQLLMPLVGHSAFGTFSQAVKYAHNFTSFSFIFGITGIALMWMKDNIPERVDLEWLRQGGGFIKSKHAPARRFNAGQKLVFWGQLGAGVVSSLSGLVLLFPFYITNVFGMQIAQVTHSLVAMLFVALILGHIYIGTLGMEGAFEAMGTGDVDFNWAKEHHDLWLQEELEKNRIGNLPASSVPAE